MSESVDDRRRALDRAIELKAFELKCVEALADHSTEGSDRAWLLSIFEGTLGTALAVARGREAGEWSQRATELRTDLVELRVERRLLELR